MKKKLTNIFLVEKKVTIEVIAKKYSDSDINSESDSGVGSVRTGTGSENAENSDSAIDSGKEKSISIKLNKPIKQLQHLNPPKGKKKIEHAQLEHIQNMYRRVYGQIALKSKCT